MGELVNREIRRHRLRADCLRILAKHTPDTTRRKRLLNMAEDEDGKIAEIELQNEAPGEPVSLDAHRWLARYKWSNRRPEEYRPAVTIEGTVPSLTEQPTSGIRK